MSAQNAEHHGVFIASLGDEKMPTRSILVAIATPTAIQNIICSVWNLLSDKFINKKFELLAMKEKTKNSFLSS